MDYLNQNFAEKLNINEKSKKDKLKIRKVIKK